jgi:hypothetical protein
MPTQVGIPGFAARVKARRGELRAGSVNDLARRLREEEGK